MDVLIRSVNIDDASVISLLSQQLGYDTNAEHTAQNIERISRGNMDMVVAAIVDDRIVGWMHVFHALRVESQPFCEIAGLVVDEQFRGRGIGRRWIEHAKHWCKRKNCNRLRVRTNTKRTATHQFYSGVGFSLVKEQKIFEMKL